MKGGENNQAEESTTSTTTTKLIKSSKKKKGTRKNRIGRLNKKIKNNNGDKEVNNKNKGDTQTKQKPKLPVQIVSSRFIKQCPLPKQTMILIAKRTKSNSQKRCRNVCIKRIGRYCMAFVNGCFVMPKCHLCMQYCYRKCHEDDTSRCHKKIYCNSTCKIDS